MNYNAPGEMELMRRPFTNSNVHSRQLLSGQNPMEKEDLVLTLEILLPLGSWDEKRVR